MTPKFWGLNANSSKTVKATDFKFDRHFLMNKTDMTENFFFRKGRGQGRVTPNFPITPLFEAPARGNPLECRDEIWHHDASFLRFDTIPACDRQTDGQTRCDSYYPC